MCICVSNTCLPACLSVSKVMERLCVRVQQQVCVLRGVGEMEEIQSAKQVLKEARNSRAVSGVKMYSTSVKFYYWCTDFELIGPVWCSKLYPSLCELAHVLSVDGPVRQRLDSLAGELAKAADKELQVSLTAPSHAAVHYRRVSYWYPASIAGDRGLDGVTLSRALPSILLCGRETESSALIRLWACVYPSLCNPDSLDGKSSAGHSPSLRVRKGLGEGEELSSTKRLSLISRLLISSNFPISFSFSSNPISCREVKLSVVSYLTNSIVDQILQELYATHKTLVNTKHLLYKPVNVSQLICECSPKGSRALSVSDPAGVSPQAVGWVWRWDGLEV